MCPTPHPVCCQGNVRRTGGRPRAEAASDEQGSQRKTTRTREEAGDMRRTHLCNLFPQEAWDPSTQASSLALLLSILADPCTLVRMVIILNSLTRMQQITQRSGSQATRRLASRPGNLCCSIFNAGVSRQLVTLILQKEFLHFALSGDCK